MQGANICPAQKRLTASCASRFACTRPRTSQSSARSTLEQDDRGPIRRRMPPLRAPTATDPGRAPTAASPRRHWRAVCRGRHLQPAATRSDREIRHAPRKRIEIGFADMDERLHAGEPRRRRSIHHVVADRHGARRGTTPNSPAVLRSIRPPRCGCRREISGCRESLMSSTRSLANATCPSAAAKAACRTAIARAPSPWTARRSKKISTDNRSAGSEREIQWSMRVLPRCDRAAPGGVFRHDAALAIGHAGLVQDIGDVGSRTLRTSDPRALRLAAFEDHGIVLVHRQQAFAAAGRSENDQRVAAWRLAQAALPHHPFGDHGGLPGERAEFAGNHFRNARGRTVPPPAATPRPAAASPRPPPARAHRRHRRSRRRARSPPRRAAAAGRAPTTRRPRGRLHRRRRDGGS